MSRLWILNKKTQIKRLLNSNHKLIPVVSDLNPASYAPHILMFIKIVRDNSSESLLDWDPRGRNIFDCIRHVSSKIPSKDLYIVLEKYLVTIEEDPMIGYPFIHDKTGTSSEKQRTKIRLTELRREVVKWRRRGSNEFKKHILSFIENIK